MFTGLIECLGQVSGLRRHGPTLELTIAAPAFAGELHRGDSVAVNGICQTVTSFNSRQFSVQATGDTLVKTSLPDWRLGRRVNLERALRADSRLDGHLVQGHVQGLARVVRLEATHQGTFLGLRLDREAAARLGSAIIPEGSIAIDGISLTVAGVTPASDGGLELRISLIPLTLDHTTLGSVRAGEAVNIETDLVLRRPPPVPQRRGLQAAQLQAWGYQ